MGVLALGVGCAPDPCEDLCSTMQSELATCLAVWPVGWEELDATGSRRFQTQCKNRWAVVRADLEPRELQDALDQCSETQDAIDALAASEDTGALCDELRALYVD